MPRATCARVFVVDANIRGRSCASEDATVVAMEGLSANGDGVCRRAADSRECRSHPTSSAAVAAVRAPGRYKTLEVSAARAPAIIQADHAANPGDPILMARGIYTEPTISSIGR